MESTALKTLMYDIMKSHVPEFKNEVDTDGDCILVIFIFKRCLNCILVDFL